MLCGDSSCPINSLECDFDCENLPSERTWTVDQAAVIVIVLIVVLVFTYLLYTTLRGGDEEIEGVDSTPMIDDNDIEIIVISDDGEG